MPFPPQGRAPVQPKFLTDITDEEWRASNYAKKEFTFDSKGPQSEHQHTINGYQFDDQQGKANVPVDLGNVEEWTIKNTTSTASGLARLIDHPFHIHINPFQITEVFDPNENLVDPETGKLEAQLVDSKTQPVPRYVTDKAKLDEQRKNPEKYPFASRQCFLDLGDPKTWSVAGACGPRADSWQSHLIWWDVFAIPSGRDTGLTREVVVEGGNVEKQPIIIPGYFKMRTRFVDYPGTYVMHCHILVHEDRGMMFTVQVSLERPLMVHHH